MRKLATAMEFYYYNKLLQIPLILLWQYSGQSVTDSVVTLTSNKVDELYPTLSRVNKIFKENAEGIVRGKAEFIYSKKWLGIYWPPGEYAILDLVENNLLSTFYTEARDFLMQKTDSRYHDLIIK